MEDNYKLTTKLADFEAMREKLFFALVLALKLNLSLKVLLCFFFCCVSFLQTKGWNVQHCGRDGNVGWSRSSDALFAMAKLSRNADRNEEMKAIFVLLLFLFECFEFLFESIDDFVLLSKICLQSQVLLHQFHVRFNTAISKNKTTITN
jgi:hypothetical protein